MTRNKGFTLIELMVVISIIALLSSIVLASISDARTKAITTKFESELQQFISALELYNADIKTYPHGGGSPVGGGSPIIITISNSNVATVSPIGTTPSLATLMLPYLKTLPTVPRNSNTQNNPAWMYITNHRAATFGLNYRCVGDTALPAYVILISNQNPVLFSAFSNLPFYQTSPALNPTVWSTVSTDRCFSLK